MNSVLQTHNQGTIPAVDPAIAVALQALVLAVEHKELNAGQDRLSLSGTGYWSSALFEHH